MGKLLVVGPVLLCGLLACLPTVPDATSSPSFVVTGKVSTGAHTRTPVSGGFIGVFIPQNGGWARLGDGSTGGIRYGATTESDGNYKFTCDVSVLSSTTQYPVFIAASDAAGTLTMISELPRDLGVDGAQLIIDINPATTVASLMICPGGVYPPPQNTWCYSDPSAPSVSHTGMIGIVDNALGGTLISLEPGSPPQWAQFASGFLNDPATFTEITNNLTAQGITLGTATPATIAADIGSGGFPIVAAPGAGTSIPRKDGGTPTGGCKLVWDCKTSSQCAMVYGAKTGSASQPDAATCNATCKSQGACTCQGC